MKTLISILMAFLLGFTLYSQELPRVYVVLFTHIEDNLPVGELNSQESKNNYIKIRRDLINMAKLAKDKNLKWVFQPDWKILLAALLYEDEELMNQSNGKNFLKYFVEDLNVAVDPHSHEKQGYNYTDVAHLLDSLDVGGSRVIGGHVWDPSLPQFQNWDRFRVPVNGSKYPWAVWQGNILMGSGTPNHVNDPIVSGVWRPKNKNSYFIDAPDSNIYCVGQSNGDIESIEKLALLYKNGSVQPGQILTVTIHIKPADIFSAVGMEFIEDSILEPILAHVNKKEAMVVDFTSLINIWLDKYGGVANLLIETNGVKENNSFAQAIEIFPNPSQDFINFKNSAECYSQIEVYNILGDIVISFNNFSSSIDIKALPSGLYYVKATCVNNGKYLISRFIKN